MAKSLDGLIRHVLDQIALCGEHGALPSDFISYVKGYYVTPSEGARDANGENETPGQKASPNIDRAFLEHIWKWLTKNPEIRVGDHIGHKHLTLSEVEARNAAIEQLDQSNSVTQQHDQGSPSAASPASKDGADSQDHRNAQTEVATNSAIGNSAVQPVQPGITARVLEAPRTLPASHEPENIPGNRQGREVSQAGIAAKVSVTPTTATVLPNSTFQPGIRLYTSENRMWYALTGHGFDLSKVKALDFIALSIIATCGPRGILQHDLTRISGQDKRSLPARTDRLHDAGYIVKERLMTDDGTGQRMIHTSRCTLTRYAKSTASQAEQAGTPLTKKERKKNKAATSGGGNSLPTATTNPNELPSHSEPQLIPQWTADRSVNNQIFDLVDQSGTQGISMNEIRGRLFGGGVRRVTEDYISRLVECWQLSQPLHLRHMSIVRDTLLRGKSQIYVYYTYENFKKLVEAGTGFWEAVTTVPDTVRQGINVAASLSEAPDVDEYGFPKLDENQFQGRHNDATLGECVSALNVGTFRLNINDPFLQKRVDGTSVIKYKASGTGHSDEPRPRKLAGSPARRGARKPRAIETPKKTTSSPTQHVSTKQRAINTPEKTAPSPARYRSEEIAPSKKLVFLTTQVDPTRAEAFENQSKRNVVRKPGKRIGRPRKYPKTGIPDNLETMTPSEIKKLRDSQEMAEKYERSKIEYEITERVRDGEDPVYVTQDVLNAADILRKQDGREVLPSFPRAQILHQFAGGPTPEPIDSANGGIESMLPSSYFLPRGGIGRRRKRVYWPSMAAHTVWVPVPFKYPTVEFERERPSKDVEILSTRTRHQEQRRPAIVAQKIVPETRPVMRYLPSVAAHSWPHVSNLVSKTEVPQIKKPKGRPRNPNKQAALSLKTNEQTVSLSPKTYKQAVPRYKYLPSIAAHSGSFLPPYQSSKRKGFLKKPTVHGEESTTPVTSSAVTHTPLTAPTREATIDLTPFSSGILGEGAYPGWIKFMSKYYQNQLETISRPHDGVFFGPMKPRRKRQCEPPDLRPREFKVAIFKLARLQEFEWFVTSPQVPGPVPSLDSRDQESLPTVTEPKTPEPGLSLTSLCQDLAPLHTEPKTPLRTGPVLIPENLHSPPISTLRQSPPVAQLNPRPALSYVSPYVDTTGAKRKRGASPQPTRGSPPPPPTSFSKSSYSDDPRPRTRSLIVTLKISTRPEAEKTSAEVGPADNDTTVELEMTHHTPERPKPTEPLSSMTPEAPTIDKQSANNRSDTPTTDRSIVTNSPSTRPADNRISIEQSADNRINTPISTPKRPSVDMGKAKLPINKNFNKMSRLGGSMAMLRKNIVMDLVEKCDGIFSGHGEMVTPFAAEWSKRGFEGTPEKRTVQNTVNQLCAEGKLRRITFTYQNKHGIVANKTMFTLANIDPADSRVKETQTHMIAYHPRYYVPEALMPTEDLRSTNAQHDTLFPENGDPSKTPDGGPRSVSELSATDLKRLNWGRSMIKGKNQVVEARLEALRAQERGEIEHPDMLMTTRGTQGDGDSGPKPRILFIPPDPPPKPVGRPKGLVEIVQQRSSIEKTPDEIVPPPLPLPQTSNIAADGADSLTWLSSEYAFSEFNFEDHRPTLVKPTISKDTRIQYARYGRKLDLSKTMPSSTKSGEQPSQRMREIKENAARIERNQAQAKTTRPSLLFSDFQSSPFESPYAPMRPPSPATVGSRSKPKDTGQGQYGPKQTSHIPAGANTSSGSRIVLPLPDTPHPELVGQPGLSQTQIVQPDLRRRLLVGFMDPVHYFNRSTGTFSVSFSGLRPPLKHLGGRGTAVRPHTHTLRPVTPYTRKGKRIASISSPQALLPRPTGRFEDDINGLLELELNTEGLQDTMFTDWPIINHVFPHPHTTAETIGAVANDYAEPAESSHPVKKRKYARSRIGHSVLNTGSKDISPAAAEALKRIQLKTPLKRRRLTSLAVNSNQDETSSAVHLDPDGRPTKFRRVRGPRGANSMGEEGEKRLLTAVVAIRTLTGGLEQHIDWVLIAKAFEGTHEQMFLHSRWGHIREKNRLIIPKMEKDFQAMFPKAYEEGKVPSLDFENLAGYDWKSLVDWTMGTFGTDLQSQPELPADRLEFDDVYTIDETPEDDTSGFYEIDGASNTAKRASIVNHSAYVCPADLKPKLASPESKEQIATAKTWVRANVITPEETYDGKSAREKLSTFSDRIIEDALKELLIDRVLMQENKGRLIPGRNYDVSENFISRLKKNLLPAHFQRALAYKKQLDLDFKERGSAPYSLTADDGDVLAIINMVAEKRITLTPMSVPAKKWGLTDGSYETRQMDKKLLNFDIELRPLPAYIEGVPLSPFPPPPSYHLHNPNAKIPLWYDIHGQLVPVMWEMALAAILALLAIRSGIGAKELEKVVLPAMDVWEIEQVLEWLVSAKAARKVGRGYAVDEWWWLALGSLGEVQSGSNGIASKDKGKGK